MLERKQLIEATSVFVLALVLKKGLQDDDPRQTLPPLPTPYEEELQKSTGDEEDVTPPQDQ